MIETSKLTDNDNVVRELSTRKSRHGPSSGRTRTPEQSRTPEKARIPEKTRTSEWVKPSNRGKAPMAQASHAPTTDCMIVEQWVPPPSQVISVREHWVASASCNQHREMMAESDQFALAELSQKKKVLAATHFGSGDRSWEGASALEESEEEVTPSLNMRKILHSIARATTFDPWWRCFRHQRARKSTKDGTASKKYRTT